VNTVRNQISLLLALYRATIQVLPGNGHVTTLLQFDQAAATKNTEQHY
jgi:hypothetical protein